MFTSTIVLGSLLDTVPMAVLVPSTGPLKFAVSLTVTLCWPNGVITIPVVHGSPLKQMIADPTSTPSIDTRHSSDESGQVVPWPSMVHLARSCPFRPEGVARSWLLLTFSSLPGPQPSATT